MVHVACIMQQSSLQKSRKEKVSDTKRVKINVRERMREREREREIDDH